MLMIISFRDLQNNFKMNGSTCLICNAPTPASPPLPRQGAPSYVDEVRVLFKLFGIDSGVLSSSSGVFSSSPYCSSCTTCVKHLNQLMAQLDVIQKQIQTYQDDIGRSVVQSFASTSNWSTVYQWKRLIFESK
jgi:hypothetical protein